jgi:hypothetical protein
VYDPSRGYATDGIYVLRPDGGVTVAAAGTGRAEAGIIREGDEVVAC